jgi:hypothetical protein
MRERERERERDRTDRRARSSRELARLTRLSSLEPFVSPNESDRQRERERERANRHREREIVTGKRMLQKKSGFKISLRLSYSL